jgi:hypothetical protein
MIYIKVRCSAWLRGRRMGRRAGPAGGVRKEAVLFSKKEPKNFCS